MATRYNLKTDGTDIMYEDGGEQTISAGGDVGGLYGINVETLAADKTLTVGTDEMYQYLDEGGADRDITLDTASATAGDRWVIRHNGAYNDTHTLTIKQSTTTIDILYATAIKKFIFDGANWIAAENGTGGDTAKTEVLAIGYGASAYSNGLAIGENAIADNNGIAIGSGADGSSSGLVIGKNAVTTFSGIGIGGGASSDTYSIAFGSNTDTNSKRYSVAIGYYSETERYGEMARNIGFASDQENNITNGGWSIETTDATATEMLAGGTAAQRYTIRASSCLAFTIHVTARDNTADECAGYKFEGVIKRDGASVTALVGTVVKTVLAEEDTSWDCNVTADDTNESLKIEVTGDATNTVQWAATSVGVETHF